MAGWDRLGWSGGLAERWMRLRDRQSLLAALLLAAAYLALSALGACSRRRSSLTGWTLPPFAPVLSLLLAANSALLLWRLVMRFGFVARAYGWREALRSLPRAIDRQHRRDAGGAARARPLSASGAAAARWDKTAHAFPRQLPAE